MGYPWQTFEDLKVYHDYHFNGMQMAIAREYKDKFVAAACEVHLLVHPNAEYCWFESLTTADEIYSLSDVELSPSDLSAVLTGASGTIAWKRIDLPESTTGVEVVWNDETPGDSSILFEISFDGGSTWKAAAKGERVSVDDENPDAAAQSIILRASLAEASDGSKPRIFDIAIFW